MNRDFVAWLQANAGVGNRVYPLVLPAKTTRPALTYQRIGGTPTIGQNFADSFTRSTVQVDAYAKTYGDAQAIKNNLLGLNGYQADSLNRVSVENIRDDYEEETKLFRVSIDFEILANEE